MHRLGVRPRRKVNRIYKIIKIITEQGDVEIWVEVKKRVKRISEAEAHPSKNSRTG
jgi:hypothetical protein